MEKEYRKILSEYIGITSETPEEAYIRKNNEALQIAKILAEKYKWKNPDKLDISYDKTKISPHVSSLVKNLSESKYDPISVPTGNIYKSIYNNTTYLEHKMYIISKRKK
jgi:hypothetical protein